MSLIDAARSGDIERIEELLDQGADINFKAIFGRTALMESVIFSNLKATKLLLDRGADVNINYKDETILMLALDYGSKEIILEIIELLDKGVNINSKNSDGSTALMYASRHGDNSLEIVKLLLDRGADINIKSKYNTTALMTASRFSNTSLETIKLLLDRGADPFPISFPITREKKSAFDYSPTRECRKLIAEYIWKKLYNRDKDTARRYSKSTSLPKDVWEIILLNKRHQQLCQNLNKNREVLEFFAKEYGIEVEMISKQLAYGKIMKNN